MHRLTAMILSLLLIASLSACGGDASSTVTESGNASTEAVDPAIPLGSEVTGEITISTYDTMQSKAFLEDAARIFEEKYPGTKVNVETFSAMPEVKTSEQGDKKMTAVMVQDDPQGRQDYISKVNTALMSGEGADILAIDVLPVHKYADGGQLENLTGYMEADTEFNREDYRTNILDAAKYKNGLWFMPLDYMFDYYAYDSTLLAGETAAGFGAGSAFTTGALTELAKPSFDGGARLFNTPDYLGRGSGGIWGSLLKENYSSFVDLENKAANFDDGSFAELLESAKQYGEEGYVSKGATGQDNAGMMMRQAGEAPTDRFFFKPKSIISLTSQFTRNLGLRMNIMMAGGEIGIEDDDEVAGIAANADGSVPFTFNQAYGINSNSANKATAWAFLKFLLSEEIQLNPNLSPVALPILNSAREKKAEAALTGGPAMGGQAPQISESQQKALEEALTGYSKAMESLSDQINTYVLRDSIVDDMIASEVAYFFDGSKTADEVAKTLQSKVDLYLNE